jgi:hypothetical protein
MCSNSSASNIGGTHQTDRWLLLLSLSLMYICFLQITMCDVPVWLCAWADEAMMLFRVQDALVHSSMWMITDPVIR